MAYVVKNTRGETIAVVDSGTTNSTATDVTLIGQNVVEYGLPQNENFVYILENFANTTPPLSPVQGQLWFDVTNNVIKYRNLANSWIATASEPYVQAQKISPAFTGTPTAPTAANGTSTTQIATTQFVANAVNSINLSGYAQLANATFTGNVAGPTANLGTNTTQLATTAFVQNTFADTSNSLYVTIQDGVLLGNPTAPTLANIFDTSNSIATTGWVQAMYNETSYSKYATRISADLVGIPTAPTPANGTSSQQLATTEFVQNTFGNVDLSPFAPKVNAALTGVPTAPTAFFTTSTNQIATTNFVQLQKTSPAFTGVPTAPTAPALTANTQIATTAFVAAATAGFASAQSVDELAGSIKMWGSSTPPNNWALCNGQAVSRTTYATLFSRIGTTYGSGDGSTTFNLPNFVDRFPVGAGTAYAAGSTGGYADAAVITHTHPVSTNASVTDNGHSHNNVLQATSDNVQRRVTLNRAVGASGTDAIGSNLGRNTDNATTGISVNVNTSVSAPTGAVSGTGRNLPPYISAYWIIKISDDGSGGGTLQAGAGIDITTAGLYSTITNTGVKSLAAGSGISVTGANGVLTVTNTGSLPTLTAGDGINIVQNGTTFTITNTRAAVPVVAGTGTTVTNTAGGAIVNANVALLQAGTGITVSNSGGTWTIGRSSTSAGTGSLSAWCVIGFNSSNFPTILQSYNMNGPIIRSIVPVPGYSADWTLTIPFETALSNQSYCVTTSVAPTTLVNGSLRRNLGEQMQAWVVAKATNSIVLQIPSTVWDPLTSTFSLNTISVMISGGN